jgi:multiple sugar transport system permease protein
MRKLVHLLLPLLAALFALPLVWLLAASLASEPELLLSGAAVRPFAFNWHNYGAAAEHMAYFTLLSNTALAAALAAAGAMLTCTLAGYSLAKLRWRGRGLLLTATVAILFIPGQVTMVPEFILMSKLGLTGSLAPVIIKPALGVPMYILLLRQFFADLPAELQQLARMDGAGEARIFAAIMLPQALPAILLVGLFQAMASWQDFVGPLLYVNEPSRYTLSLGLQQFQSELGTDWGQLTAAAMLTLLPLLLVFAAVQGSILGRSSLIGIKD